VHYDVIGWRRISCRQPDAAAGDIWMLLARCVRTGIPAGLVYDEVVQQIYNKNLKQISSAGVGKV
jgi:hypothetical protein